MSDDDVGPTSPLEPLPETDALEERATIDLAIDLVAAQRHLTPDRARQHLTDAAARAGVPVVVVARVIVGIHTQGGAT